MPSAVAGVFFPSRGSELVLAARAEHSGEEDENEEAYFHQVR